MKITDQEIKTEISAQLETENYDVLIDWYEHPNRVNFQSLDDYKICQAFYPEDISEQQYSRLEQKVNRILQSDWFQAELEDTLHDIRNEQERRRNPYKFHGVHPSQF